MSVEDEIARFDWSRIQTYLGHAEMVPDAVTRACGGVQAEVVAKVNG